MVVVVVVVVAEAVAAVVVVEVCSSQCASFCIVTNELLRNWFIVLIH